MPLEAINLSRLLNELLELEFALHTLRDGDPELAWKSTRRHVKRAQALLPADLDLIENLPILDVERLADFLEEIWVGYGLNRKEGALDFPVCKTDAQRLREFIHLVERELANPEPNHLKQYTPPDPPSEVVGEKPADSRAGKKKSKVTTNDRMKLTLVDNPEAASWSLSQWATHLKCGKSTVHGTPTWTALRAAHCLAKVQKLKDQEEQRGLERKGIDKRKSGRNVD